MSDLNNPNENTNQPQNGLDNNQTPYVQPSGDQTQKDGQYQQPQNGDPSQYQQSQYGDPSQYQQPQYQQPQYNGQSPYQQSQYNQQNQYQNQSQYQNQNHYQNNYQYNQQPPSSGKNSTALISLICGIISFVFGCCLWRIMWIPSIAGIVLGIISLRRNKENNIYNRNDKIMSIIGIVLAGISLLMIVILIIVVVVFRDGLLEILREYGYNY